MVKRFLWLRAPRNINSIKFNFPSEIVLKICIFYVKCVPGLAVASGCPNFKPDENVDVLSLPTQFQFSFNFDGRLFGGPEVTQYSCNSTNWRETQRPNKLGRNEKWARNPSSRKVLITSRWTTMTIFNCNTQRGCESRMENERRRQLWLAYKYQKRLTKMHSYCIKSKSLRTQFQSAAVDGSALNRGLPDPWLQNRKHRRPNCSPFSRSI